MYQQLLTVAKSRDDYSLLFFVQGVGATFNKIYLSHYLMFTIDNFIFYE